MNKETFWLPYALPSEWVVILHVLAALFLFVFPIEITVHSVDMASVEVATIPSVSRNTIPNKGAAGIVPRHASGSPQRGLVKASQGGKDWKSECRKQGCLVYLKAGASVKDVAMQVYKSPCCWESVVVANNTAVSQRIPDLKTAQSAGEYWFPSIRVASMFKGQDPSRYIALSQGVYSPPAT